MRNLLFLAVSLFVLASLAGCGVTNAAAPTNGATNIAPVPVPGDTTTVPTLPALTDGKGGLALGIDGGGNVVVLDSAGARAVSNRWPGWTTADVVVYDVSTGLPIVPAASVTLTHGLNQYATFSGLAAGKVVNVHVTLKVNTSTVATGVSSPDVVIVAGKYVAVAVTLSPTGFPTFAPEPVDGDKVGPTVIMGGIVSDPGADRPNVELFLDDGLGGAFTKQGSTVTSFNPEWSVSGLVAPNTYRWHVVIHTSYGTVYTSSPNYSVIVSATGGLDVGILQK